MLSTRDDLSNSFGLFPFPSFRSFSPALWPNVSDELNIEEAGGNEGGTKETSLGNEPLALDSHPLFVNCSVYPSVVFKRPRGVGR